MHKIILILLFPVSLFAQNFTPSEINRWESRAKNITIIRDNWGIPHIYGKTDADAVFGLLYAQCEDDFPRVEMNYIEKLGRKAEIFGEKELYNDLYLRMIIKAEDAKNDYAKAPQWLKQLLNAYADGINFYLYKHPNTKPKLLLRFEPWFPLLWTDGSIGAINTGDITEQDVKNFYTNNSAPVVAQKKLFEENAIGSNGFAIAPSKTESGNAILYINPHVTFYFRPEVHVVSEAGLNAYGAVTWGQFFVYQGFNEHCGWMHTSSNVDVADLYQEKIIKKNNQLFYEYDKILKPVKEEMVTIKYKEDDKLIEKKFTIYSTHHGPIMTKRNGIYISVKSNNRMMNGLMQSWLRTKAKGFEEYKKIMELRGNTSNNTVFADDKGNIAYWHGNFVPVRNKNINWAKPVDGSVSINEWMGLHQISDIVHVYNPVSGWIQNCNSTPYTVSGSSSPNKQNFPNYMAPDGENFRGVNAIRVLSNDNKFTIEKIIKAGYDTKLSAFEILIPALVKAFEKLSPSDSLYEILKQPVQALKNWNYNVSIKSVETTLAIEWAQKLIPALQKIYIDEGEEDQIEVVKKFAANANTQNMLIPLQEVIKFLKNNHGDWKIEWGAINRFQRVTGEVEQKFSDDLPSIAIPFASAVWGMLPSYNSRYFEGTKKRYGVSGNSFICAVEFGKRIKAMSLLAGGENNNPQSPHFFDQGNRYANGIFKEVLFYKEDVMKHAEKTYNPGKN